MLQDVLRDAEGFEYGTLNWFSQTSLMRIQILISTLRFALAALCHCFSRPWIRGLP